MIFGPGDDRRTRVKVCGITHPDDAALAAELGADALGLNFYAKSPRALDLARDGGWLRALPAGLRRVAVLVNAPFDFAVRLVGEGIVDAVQLHGDEDEAFCRRLQAANVPFIKAIRVRDESALLRPERFGTDHLLLDAFRPDAYGGTGHTLDWTLAARFAAEGRAAANPRRTILSGGLVPGNVAEAVRRVRPDAVDVASGVEGAGGPRRKDPERLRAFLAAVREAGRKVPRPRAVFLPGFGPESENSRAVVKNSSDLRK